MAVDQFVLPQMTWSRPRTDGAVEWTEGISRAMAAASSWVMLGRVPKPRRTPVLATLPGRT